MDVVTLGETMVVLKPFLRGRVAANGLVQCSIAGAESNVAIACARLGMSVGFATRVGADPFGEIIRSTLGGEGLSMDRIVTTLGVPTGIMVREAGRGTEPNVYYHRRGSAATTLDQSDVDRAWVQSATVLHLTGITAALSDSCRQAVDAAIDAAIQAGTTIVFDPNIRFKLWPDREAARTALLRLAARADVVLPGLAEAQFLTGLQDPVAAGRALLTGRTRLVGLKLGSSGSCAITQSHVVTVSADPVAHMVDPIGAGDAWAAGLLSVITPRIDDLTDPVVLDNALRRANLLGRLATTFEGDWEGLPRRDEVEAIERGDDPVTR